MSWFATPYFNLGVTEEKADHPKEAMESFRWYLLGAPDAKDAADVKKRLFKLEYVVEQQSLAAVANAEQSTIRAQEQHISATWGTRCVSAHENLLPSDQSFNENVSVDFDGKGRWRDNVFVERLWRSVKYEEVYLHA